MNDVTLLRDHGPAAPASRDDVLAAARARLTAEIAAAPAAAPAAPGTVASAAVAPAAVAPAAVAPAPRPVALTRRRLAVGAVLAVAAAVAAAVGVAVTGTPERRPPAPITLAAFETPSFPVTLRPEPAGLTVSFNQEPDGRMLAIHRDATGEDGFVVHAGPPRTGPTRGETVEDVTVAGHAAQFVREPVELVDGTVGETRLVTWRRPDGVWITISAMSARYGDRATLLALAETVVDEPRPVPLQLRVAPTGWSVHAFKDRVLTMRDDADETRTLSIHVPAEPPRPRDRLEREVGGASGPPRPVTVQGRTADLVPTADGWWLQAAFADGTPFVLQAPAGFTAADVVAIADEASYTP